MRIKRAYLGQEEPPPPKPERVVVKVPVIHTDPEVSRLLRTLTQTVAALEKKEVRIPPFPKFPTFPAIPPYPKSRDDEILKSIAALGSISAPAAARPAYSFAVSRGPGGAITSVLATPLPVK